MTKVNANRALLTGLVGLLFTFGSCGGEASTTPLQIPFLARVGTAPFACGSVYPGVGASAANVEIEDFRMFISNVRTLDKAGQEHPVQLVGDGKWQSSTVALLDFENAVGPCGELGTAEMNNVLKGTSDGSQVSGLRFSLGVPEAEAHQNVGTAAAPLSLGAMFWSWQAGYKFLRLDFRSSSADGLQFNQYLIHVGSTGCQSAASSVAPTTACARSNRVEVSLVGWVPGNNVVVDLGALLANVDVLKNTEGTAPGCMSDATDPECQLVLPGLGIEAASGQCSAGCAGQKLFRAE